MRRLTVTVVCPSATGLRPWPLPGPPRLAFCWVRSRILRPCHSGVFPPSQPLRARPVRSLFLPACLFGVAPLLYLLARCTRPSRGQQSADLSALPDTLGATHRLGKCCGCARAPRDRTACARCARGLGSSLPPIRPRSPFLARVLWLWLFSFCFPCLSVRGPFRGRISFSVRQFVGQA